MGLNRAVVEMSCNCDETRRCWICSPAMFRPAIEAGWRSVSKPRKWLARSIVLTEKGKDYDG
jgi:hypothetical protein